MERECVAWLPILHEEGMDRYKKVSVRRHAPVGDRMVHLPKTEFTRGRSHGTLRPAWQKLRRTKQ